MCSDDAQVYIENDITHNKLKSKSEDLAENLSNIRDKAMQTGAVTPLSELMPQQEISTARTKTNIPDYKKLSDGIARILQAIIAVKQQDTSKTTDTLTVVKDNNHSR